MIPNRIDDTVLAPLPSIKTDSSVDKSTDEPSFGEVLEEAIASVRGALHAADKTSADAMVGEASPHEAMIATAKADLQFRMMTQTRNKLVNAYNELMNLRM